MKLEERTIIRMVVVWLFNLEFRKTKMKRTMKFASARLSLECTYHVRNFFILGSPLT